MSAASRRAAAAAQSRESDAPESGAPSGRLLLRMPRTLHGALTEAAEREGTSLNQFITGTLASAIGWNGEGALKEAPRTPAGPGAAESAQSRRLFYLLVANAVAVGIAGLAAIVILLYALLS